MTGTPPDDAGLLTLRVDDERLRISGALDEDRVHDILLNDRHVWSLQPSRDMRPAADGVVVKWPGALRSYLKGHARVVLRDHADDVVLAAVDHVFAGDDTREVTVTDKEGHTLILDKWGRLTRPLSAENTGIIDELLEAVGRLLEDLEKKAGVPAFICYGTLLGAIRNGELIGHDNDVDVAYLSRHPHPVDVVREAYRVERALVDAGWLVRRGSGVRINVRLHLSDRSTRFIDVFTANWVEGVLYIPSDTGFELPEDVILPLRPTTLHGRELPGPADPERLLAATYGEGWRTPDPSFKYETPRWLARRFGGWFGGLKTGRKHWDAFYLAGARGVPKGPSPFARWVSRTYPSTRPLVELGSGTGRDALWFAKAKGRRVTAFDYSVPALHRNRRRARRRGVELNVQLGVHAMNLYDAREVLALGTRLSRAPEPVDLYARFTMHALDHVGRRNVLRLASMSLRRGGLLFLEFRTGQDGSRSETVGPRRRYLLAPAVVVRQIEAAGGRVVRLEKGRGLAKLKGDDPHVCRIVASWSDQD